jgi:hypothetical protein
VTDYQKLAGQKAKKYGLPDWYFRGQIGAESNFNPNARSPAGAVGIAQIMPETARGWGVDPRDPVASLDAAARNMAGYVKKYGLEGALRAYNAGPGAVERSKNFAETNAYVKKIMQGRTAAAPSSGQGGGMTSAPVPAGPAAPQAGVNPFSTIAALGAGNQSPFADTLQRGWDLLGRIWEQKYGGQQQSSPMLSQMGNQQGSSDDGGGGKLPSGVAKFDGKEVAAWIKPALEYARQQGWKGTVNSGFRSLADQTRIYNSGVRPAAKPGTSNHEGADYPRGAVDVSDAQQLSRILANSPWRKRLQWAGAKDPVHFSHPHNGSY